MASPALLNAQVWAAALCRARGVISVHPYTRTSAHPSPEGAQRDLEGLGAPQMALVGLRGPQRARQMDRWTFENYPMSYEPLPLPRPQIAENYKCTAGHGYHSLIITGHRSPDPRFERQNVLNGDVSIHIETSQTSPKNLEKR